MKNLSNRLLAIADMVRFSGLVDIGSDHAHLPIYLIGAGRCARALATDISPKSLAKGRENAAAAGLCGQIDFQLARGFALALSAEAYETCVIAGMGGENIMGIIKDAPKVAKGFKQLILSPQRDAPALRRFLHEFGFKIVNEVMVSENGKFYNILDCAPGTQEAYDEAGYAFGQALIERNCPILAQFIKSELRKFEEIHKYIKLCEEILYVQNEGNRRGD
ncbi:MAG: class I SAM-dependent methyltransferase [Clostridiales bacterium]|jgi:tRNA (adenine22-N1)-methyltransferase|nr:class I SAM-dependent methyltransferase [Clostridiales bacterium]